MGFFDEIKQELIDQLYGPNADDEVEAVVVKFNDGVTANRNINVVVDRPAPDSTGQTSSPALIIHVVNDATYGITSAELDAGKVTFEISPRYGQAAQDINIRRIETHDPAEMVLILL